MKYLVKSPIQMDGVLYNPGRKINLEPETAALMPWAVEAIPEVPKTKPEGDKDKK
jgi:hypothetical protein